MIDQNTEAKHIAILHYYANTPHDGMIFSYQTTKELHYFGIVCESGRQVSVC